MKAVTENLKLSLDVMIYRALITTTPEIDLCLSFQRRTEVRVVFRFRSLSAAEEKNPSSVWRKS